MAKVRDPEQCCSIYSTQVGANPQNICYGNINTGTEDKHLETVIEIWQGDFMSLESHVSGLVLCMALLF